MREEANAFRHKQVNLQDHCTLVFIEEFIREKAILI